MKVKYTIDFGFAGCTLDGEEEFGDGTPEDNIEAYIRQIALDEADNNLSWE